MTVPEKVTPTGQVGATGTSTTMKHNTSIITPAPLLEPIIENFPARLRAYDRWCVWRADWLPNEGKYSKVPRSAIAPHDRPAKTNSSAGWGTYEQAVSSWQDFSLLERGGIGFKLTGIKGIVALDLDHCVVDGKIQQWAQEVIQKAQSYTEVSPSGTGVRIFVRADLYKDWQHKRPGGAELEIYGGSGGRYVTVTGHHLDDTPNDVMRAPDGFIDWLEEAYPRVASAPAQALDMPELLPLESLPTVDDLRQLPGMSSQVVTFMDDGTLPVGFSDRSSFLQQIANELVSATGGDRQMAWSIILHNPHSWAMLLDKRAGDENKAMDFAWRHNCLKVNPDIIISNYEFDDVTPTARERDEQASQERAALDAKRREHQKRENERIGEGAYRIPIAEKITLESALERFVFLSEGSLVADVFNPHYVLKLADWRNTYAASVKELPGTPGKPPKVAPVSQLWHTSERRKTVTTRTFKAGGGLMLADPVGKSAVNSWRPFDRTLQVADPRAAGVGLFLDHVAFLFGDDAPRFLDWLAHIEQKPGMLPHTAWLHIARNFGMGRNWLASVLARVWAGSVAANLDLVHVLKSSFNGQLSRKVLAVVDEIREGGRESQWEHSEKLKSIITEEVRSINPKYGHTSVEFNACRWLLFSNHLSAIPLENGDRRIEVVSIEAQPRSADYYTRLYRALESREFIAAVATVLRERDISGFNPGAHARITEAKKAATNASRTPMAEACQLLVDYWPADFIKAADLFDVLTGGQAVGALTAAHRRTLEQAGIHAWGKPVKIGGKATRVSVLRNRARWLQQGTADEVRKELERVKVDTFEATAHEYLLGVVADA